ncbi:Fe3+ hydroxamate ABC transporter substrate-binding protein [Vibrio cholerae]|nr:Fe3+ hydroxamate ABC transporter substrate-binding protein [Vibrio cholerae]MEB3777548.1 Fe3+ hydroxamate ABC transporter substrate-binding protein [Vibrio sp. R-1]EGQ9612534.1 Fe3+ hydroxamate ABC transporter substrate-binding protein [Vibrio cholerae]EGQ9845951.1 Fe3+ hydroxamate ABC transporter substrate-binding protein [Vibrio cholerae]EGR0287924.1 Fe3+ hydroxamate ABC transporter substrate-binding protein [Vibrio cholerae]
MFLPMVGLWGLNLASDEFLIIEFFANQYVLNEPQIGSFLLFGPCLVLSISQGWKAK